MHPILFFFFSTVFLLWAVLQLVELSWPWVKKIIRLYLSL